MMAAAGSPALARGRSRHLLKAQDGDILDAVIARSQSGPRAGLGKGAGQLSDMQKIKPEVAEQCKKVVEEYAALFPKNASEERMFRRRMAKTPLQLLLRQGAPLDEVAKHAALQVGQRWVSLLRPHVRADDAENHLQAQIIALVWRSGDRVLPKGPLGKAIRDIVPTPEQAETEQWEYLHDLVEVGNLQAQLDPNSTVHTPTPSGYKLAARCGMEPKVWVDGPPVSDMPRATYIPTDGCRRTVSNLSREQMGAIYNPKVLTKVPGPGHYDVDRTLFAPGIRYPSAGEFRSVGKGRTKCLVSPLETFPRILQ